MNQKNHSKFVFRKVFCVRPCQCGFFKMPVLENGGL